MLDRTSHSRFDSQWSSRLSHQNRDSENAFLQTRVTLPPIEEILSIDAGLALRGEIESPFDPQRFFAGRLFKFWIEWIEFNKNWEGRNLSSISVALRSIDTQKTYENMRFMRLNWMSIQSTFHFALKCHKFADSSWVHWAPTAQAGMFQRLFFRRSLVDCYADCYVMRLHIFHIVTPFELCVAHVLQGLPPQG
jgi:hypothetical protein